MHGGWKVQNKGSKFSGEKPFPSSAALEQWIRLTKLNRSTIIRIEPVYKQKASWLRLFLNDFFDVDAPE